MFKEKTKSLESMKAASSQHKKERDFWLNKLSGEWVKSSFPTDFESQGNDIKECKNPGAIEFEISGDLFHRLMHLSNSSDSRLHMVLVTGLLLLLHKYSGHKDIIIGIPIYKQDIEEELINTVVALRNKLEENLTVKHLLLQVRESIGEAIENYSYPIELLLEQLNLPYPGKDFPLFDVVILLENIHDKTYLQHIKTKMIFYFNNTGIKITGGVEYNTVFYQESSIERIVGNLKQVLNTSFLNVHVQIKDIDILSEKEKRQLLMDFNDNKADFPGDKTIYHFIEEYAERNPHHIVIACEGNECTYRQLNKRTNRLAHSLISCGIKADEPVGILLERSPLMVESILAIWKAGGAYLPIEPVYPGERIDYMLSDCKAKVLITTSSLAEEGKKVRKFEGKKILLEEVFETSGNSSTPPSTHLDLPSAPTTAVSSSTLTSTSTCQVGFANMAYIIYTSGSTGKPKGAMVEHIGMMNHIQAKINALGITANSIIVQNAPYTFDISVWQFFTTFIVEGKTIIYPDDLIMEPDRFLFQLIRYQVTILEVVPSYLAILLETLEIQPGLINPQTAYFPLNYLLVTGEEIKPALIEKWFEKYPQIKMVNAYGPTEASDDITHYIMDKAPALEQIPIGKPLQNFNIYILDDHMHLCPIGVKGEIWVSGIGVGRGYLNNPELTIEKFCFPQPGALFIKTAPGPRKNFLLTKFYRTGDLGCWRPDGTIEFFGRKDYQVKIRGFRVELGEIEAQILKFIGVKDVVVIDRDNISAEKYLCAYIVLKKKLNISLLREYLTQKLPDYMIPSHFVTLDELPLTPNGKIDRKALPAPAIGLKSMIYISEEKLNQFEESPTEKRKEIDESFKEAENQNLLDHQEREQILFTFNETAAEYPEDKMIGQLFEEQVEKTPDNTAVEFKEKQLTYNLLNQRVNRLANLLRIGCTGLSPIMGIMVDPSLEMMIGILAILKAGGIFMPMDPEAPEERHCFVMEDTRAELLLTTRNMGMDTYSYPYKRINLEDEQSYKEDDSNPLVLNIPTAPTHLLYTSGTTGIPKGVILGNCSVVNLMKSVADMINFSGDDHVLSVTPITFDVFTAETILPLTKGSKIEIGLREAVIDYRITAPIIEKKDITIYQSTPSILQRLISDPGTASSIKNLRYLLTAGEPLMESLLEQLKSNTKGSIYNLYGPTETTLYSTGCDLTHESHVTIGKPLYNTRVYILDKNEQVMPIGNVGELCIGGIGCARGYLNRPELTAEKFVVNPYLENDRIYKTGDLAKWLPEGNIEYIGRIDHQVKLGGIRIEPGEIENCLLTYGSIKEAAVVVKQNENEEKYLCAYLVLEKRIDEDALRIWLPGKLPHYMIPAIFVQLEKMPLTPNRKINRKLLTALEIEIDISSHYLAPANEIEEKMAEIWSTVLNIPKQAISVVTNFFEMGGHSLSAITIIAKIHKAFDVKVPLIEMFKTPSVRGIAGYIQKSKKDRYESIEPAEKKEYYALSSAQERLYILQQMALENPAYNIPQVVPLLEKPDIKKLEETFIKLIKRHESLSTSFHLIHNEPVQKIHDMVEFEIGYYVCASSQEEIKESNLIDGGNFMVSREQVMKRFGGAFHLSQPPLLRVGILRTGNDRYVLAVVMHHIISDGVSLEILVKDFMALREKKNLPPLRIHYKDFSQWQNSEKEKGNIRKQGKYWLQVFGNEVPVLHLPTDYPRPMMQRFEGTQLNFGIDETKTRLLKKLALQKGATVYMVLLAVYNVFLAKISGQEDIVVGTPTAGRRHTDLQQVVGMFANTLALRNFPIGEKSFPDFLVNIKDQTIEAFENQDYQFEDLVEQVTIARDTSRNPLFDVMFVLQNINEESKDISQTKDEIPGEKENKRENIQKQEQRQDEFGNQTSKFDLVLNGQETHGRLIFSLGYSTRLFKRETIERFVTYLESIVTAVPDNPNVRISDIEILPAKEKRQILYDFNKTGTKYPADRTLHGLFAEQVKRTPDNIAVVGVAHELHQLLEIAYPGGTGDLDPLSALIYITYSQLNEKSNRLTHLLKEKGIQPDTIVGIMMERSIEMIITLLGILKAGCAYMPIDPGYPPERIHYMLADSRAKVLVTTRILFEDRKIGRWESKKNIEIVLLDFSTLPPCCPSTLPATHLDLSPAPAACLAYIIYTSGSTGRPKGVLVEHRNAVNVNCWFGRSYLSQPNTHVLMMSDYTFDPSVNQVFGSLLHGAVLYMVNKQLLLNFEGLGQYIEMHQVDVVNFVPAAFNELLGKGKKLNSIRVVLSGGERLDDEVKNNIIQRDYMLYNQYGPTETTIDALVEKCSKEKVTLGRPISNACCYIFDKYNHLVPVGVVGELYVGGAGVARGYLNNPELTARKFYLRQPGGTLFEKTAPPGPPRKNFSLERSEKDYIQSCNHASMKYHSPIPQLPIIPLPHYPIYRTGDLARCLPNGKIEFLGRIDNQVKIRGFRVEPGEIENQLLKHNKIKEAVVLVREVPGGNLNDRYICAYFVPSGEFTLKPSELKKFLIDDLPDYMIPSFFIQLEKIPLTHNAKVDRKALSERVIEIQDTDAAPTNEIESKLVDIWSTALNIDKTLIGVQSNFFELGGHSLKAVIMAAKIHKAFDVNVPLMEIFTTPFIRGLAEYISSSVKDKFQSIDPRESKENYPLSSAQKRLYAQQLVEIDTISHNMPQVLLIEGKLDKEQVEDTFKKLITRHESFRTAFYTKNEEVLQKIYNPREITFALMYDEAKEEEAVRIVKGMIKPFGLGKAPLMRVSLLKIDEEKHILLIDIHHIITDGISQKIIINDLLSFYQGNELPPLRLQYKDFSQWQNSKRTQKALKKQREYWLKQFEKEIPTIQLPTDYERPHVRSFEGSDLDFEIETEETNALKKWALDEDITLFILLLALFQVLLSKVTGQEDIVVGTAVTGRRHPDLESIIGMFINMLALRNFPSGKKPFSEFLREVRTTTLNAFENQDYLFEDLVQGVLKVRNPRRNPLFDVVFSLENIDKAPVEIPTLEIKPLPYEMRISKFDLTMVAVETRDKLHFNMEYRTKLFKQETIEMMAAGFKEVVSSVLDNKNIKLKDIKISHGLVSTKSMLPQMDFDF